MDHLVELFANPAAKAVENAFAGTVMMRMLIIDADLVSRKKIQRIFKHLGDSVAVSDGEAGLESFRQAWQRDEPFDLICLDVNVSGLAWQDSLAAIRQMEDDMELGSLARVKVVMVSSLSDPASVAEAKAAGCDDYIVKPINPQAFLERIDRLFP